MSKAIGVLILLTAAAQVGWRAPKYRANRPVPVPEYRVKSRPEPQYRVKMVETQPVKNHGRLYLQNEPAW